MIEDCVETFVLHQMMRHVLSHHSSDALISLAFARPFSHYDRILRKLVNIIHHNPFFSFYKGSSHCWVCNLASQKANNRLVFVDMLMMNCSGGRLVLSLSF
ncbi:hypothetical protein Bca4012_066127 [Brassica carinata]|uniref:Uncharacterized protein n=1 Tax=Brassica carinata TaxID=52824 RepID=A0A8X8AXF0_BRACI|nr:hypothetical protein Bca52824_018417 [Brassica carinata]